VLQPNVYLRDLRVLKRFVGRKLGVAATKKESLLDLYRLIRWNHKYDRDTAIEVGAVIVLIIFAVAFIESHIPHRDCCRYHRWHSLRDQDQGEKMTDRIRCAGKTAHRKGIITQQEFIAKISKERKTYQAMFKPTPH
jgi:hypothetical protein